MCMFNFPNTRGCSGRMESMRAEVDVWELRRGYLGKSARVEEEGLFDVGGANRDRTDDLLNAIQALSQTELQPHRQEPKG